MPSYSSWNGVKCSANKHLLTEILKQELGFEGFLISDYNAIDQISPDYKKDAEIAINAGMDMVMVTKRYPELFTNLKTLVQEGKVPVSRIPDDAVTRILRVKFAMGLMDTSRSPLADRDLQNSFGSAEHRLVARQAVRESLVLLKNGKSVLPLRKSANIVVAGKGAPTASECSAEVGPRDWQGKMDNIVPGGTTMLLGIQATVNTHAKVTFSPDGNGAEGADVGIAVIGEKPYAEYHGDRAALSLDDQDIATVTKI